MTGIFALDIVQPNTRLPGVEYHTHDVRQPIPIKWGRNCRTLYNFAAIHRTPGHAEHEYYDTNTRGAFSAAALADLCNIPTVVFTSSISVYGPSEETLTESSPTSAVSAYGRSKLIAEMIHQQWATNGPGRQLVIVRPGVIFGPGEGGNYSLLSRSLRRGYFFYPGRRDTIKSGGYVDELLDTFEFTIAKRENYILYNFAYPAMSTTQEIVQTFDEVAGYGKAHLTLPLPALLFIARMFEIASALGLKNGIHRERVMKLVQSTRVSPAWLEANGYKFKTDLKSALTLWRDETDGRFV